MLGGEQSAEPTEQRSSREQVPFGWEAVGTLQIRIRPGAGEEWEILGCGLKIEQAGFWYGIASVGC